MFLTRVGSGALLLKVGLTQAVQIAEGAAWWGIERIGAYIRKGGRLR